MRFESLNMTALAKEEAARRAAPLQLADLIARYPFLSPLEVELAIGLYRRLSALDMALMLSDYELAPKLDRFYKDHWRKLKTPFRQYAMLLVIALAGIALAVWAGTVGIM